MDVVHLLPDHRGNLELFQAVFQPLLHQLAHLHNSCLGRIDLQLKPTDAFYDYRKRPLRFFPPVEKNV